ncbi:hypothetical protein AGMMS49579_11720 [Spirochaetia bacterium]|nr:hypothetical protein AGMMS49579_11720 [Spirochaetia bacterium]
MKKFFIVLITIALTGAFFIGCNDQVQDMQYKEMYTGTPGGGSFSRPTTLDPALYESEIRLMYQPTHPANLADTSGKAYEFSRSLSKDGKTGSLLVTESKDTFIYSGWTKTAGAEKIKKDLMQLKTWADVLTAVNADINDTTNYATATNTEAHSITVFPNAVGVTAGKPPLTYTFTQKHTLQVTNLYKYTGAFE